MLRKLRDYNPKKKTQATINLILQLVAKYDISLTVRQIHYLLVETKEANHPNTLNGYQKVSRIVTDMRYGGLLDWSKIVDETRSVYKQTSYESIDDAIEELLESYRKDRWEDSEYYVEVWVEKRTLVNLLYPITNRYDVHLAGGGGFSSSTYIHEAADRLNPYSDREIIVLYFGDLDPSGDFMSEDIENRFAEWGIDLSIERLCLNEEQLEQYGLPKKFDVKARKGAQVYNKIEADPRAKRFLEKHGELFQVELEALNPTVIRSLLESAISEYVDSEQHEKVKQVEQSEIAELKRRLSSEGG
jgi:hypothetical protein